MTPLEDCCYSCAHCQRPVCGDLMPMCSHDDELSCDSCCEIHHDVAEEVSAA